LEDHAATSIAELENAEAKIAWMTGRFVSRETPELRGTLGTVSRETS